MSRHAPLEKDLAALVVDHLRAEGHDIFQEVRHRDGRTADIVAMSRLDGRVHVVEVKAHAGLSVIEQAHFWRGRAAHSSVAVPSSGNPRDREFFLHVCREFGIGVFLVGASVVQVERPAYDRTAGLQFQFGAEHLDAKAGTSSHEERPSKTRSFRDEIAEIVTAHPQGIPLLDVIELMETRRFRRDKGGVESLRKAIKEVEGVETKRRGGEWCAMTTAAFYGRASA